MSTPKNYPSRSDLPNIRLYMDQLLEFLSGCGVSLTKTMINNYVKQGVIAPPHKKRYGSSDIEDLFLLDLLKNSFLVTEAAGIIRRLKETTPDYYCRFVEAVSVPENPDSGPADPSETLLRILGLCAEIERLKQQLDP